MENKKELTISYDVVHDVLGHQENKNVPVQKAAENIFKMIREKAMECSINGVFVSVETVKELENKLTIAAQENKRVSIHDEVTGG